MCGDKTLPQKVKVGGRSKERINVSYYITKKEFNELRSAGDSLPDICSKIGFPSNERTLYKYVTQLGWNVGGTNYKSSKVTEVNEDFFKRWTRESAWVYGWLLTDGYIGEDSGHISLNLKHADKDVLEKVKNVMEFTGDISFYEYSDGRQASKLRICRKGMTEDIFALGMARKDKTFNTTMPDIPDKFYWDFVRGVFEGDGSVRHRTGNTDALDITICGATKQFILDLQSSLEKRGIFMRLSTRKANSCSGNKHEMYTLNTKSNADALRMCYFMYANTTEGIRLNRKFNVYQNYVVTYYDKVKRRSAQCSELVELARQTIPECVEIANRRIDEAKRRAI